MNKAQQIFTDAGKAAVFLAGETDLHTLTTKTLAEFETQGHDPLDFPAWFGAFTLIRTETVNDTKEAAARLAPLEDSKAASEIAAEKAKAAAAK